MGYYGLSYTWDNRQQGDRNIKLRLDRALVDDKFTECFDNTIINHIQCIQSDHCALQISVRRSDWVDEGMDGKPFRLENAWTRHERYNQMVEESRQTNVHDLQGVYEALGGVRDRLKIWSREEFGSVRKQLKNLRQRLERIRGNSMRSGPCREEKTLMNKISELLSREESLARLRSRAQWLKEGDRNTSFFHAKAKERARINKIKYLKRADGSVVTSQGGLETEAKSFYQALFTAHDVTDPELINQWVAPKVDDFMNERLCAPITNEEVEKALFMMYPDKSPGPDGFTAGFYIRHWNLLKNNICEAVRLLLSRGDMPEMVNSTVLVLIPKVKNPQEMAQFRPISLCNVLYKIASKVLALRLRPFLKHIISEEQSAFVPGRLITDNVLLAYESIHYLQRKKGKAGSCAVKLDMAKAYDRVEWSYLRAIMTKLGFAKEWINRVMCCVETVSFSVRVNGNFSEVFKPSRGIRQGDPISPYLFLLCGEGFSCMLRNYGAGYLSKGIRVGIHCPWISHLLFADDC